MAKGDLNEMIRTGFIGISTLAAGIGVDQIKGLSTQMAALNEKMAVVVNQVTQQDKTTDDHEARIRRLEFICGKCARAKPLDISKIEAHLGG